MREARLRALYRDVTNGVRPASELLRRAAAEHGVESAPYTSVESQIFARCVTLLLDAVGLIERAAFAREVAALPHTPPTVLARLLDDDHLVVAPVLELAPFSDLELLRLVAARDVEREHCAIARRERLGESVSDVLVVQGRPHVLTTLAGNRAIGLSRQSLETLCDVAVRLTTVGAALARRSDLPGEIVEMLARRMDAHHLVVAEFSDDALIAIVAEGEEAQEIAVAWRSPLSVRLTDFLIARGRNRTLLVVAGNTGAQISALGFLVLSSLAVDMPDMDAALARRTDLPPEIARNLYRRVADQLQARIDRLIVRDLARGRRSYVLRQG